MSADLPNSQSLIEVRLEQHIGTIVLDHRAKHNAIGRALVEQVIAALDSLRERDARAVVLRARDGVRVWSAGHDVDELQSLEDPLAESATLLRLLDGIARCPLPVIAMIQGSVWGGATDLVLSCDLAVGDASCTFAMPAANLGLAYNLAGLRRFASRLPLHRVRELFFTATPVSADQALAWGILNHLVANDQLERFTYEMAQVIASRAPLAIAAVKEQLRVLASGVDVAPEVERAIDESRRRAHQSADFREGLAAFREKRRPDFRGQ